MPLANLRVSYAREQLSDPAHFHDLDSSSATPNVQAQGAFCRFPNSVARDKRVSARTLVILAYRCTIADDERAYGLHEKALVKAEIVRAGTGLGVNAIRSAIAEAKRLDYIKRGQNGRHSKPGGFRYATERLALPPCGRTGRAGRHVRREWFDGSLSVKEMAAFLYLRAGTGRGPFTYAREIERRFGWSRPTVAKVLRKLIDLRLVEEQTCRDNQGQFEGTTYSAASTTVWGKAAPVKKPCNGSPCNGKPCNTRN